VLFLAIVALSLLTVRLAGGTFTALSQLPLRAVWLVVAALGTQILTISVLVHPPHWLAAALHLLSYLLAGAFLWQNRRLRGLPVAALGGGLNLLAISANAGTMPASPVALRTAGIVASEDHFANSTAVDDARLLWLGDVFAVPDSAGPLANVFSIGDLVLILGAVWLLHAAAGCKWAVATSSARTSCADVPPAADLSGDRLFLARDSRRRLARSDGGEPVAPAASGGGDITRPRD
jgi:hypothetical protein